MIETLEVRYEASWTRGEGGDGREITGVCAPYGVPAVIEGPNREPLRVKLSAGAFRRNIAAADRLELRYEHAADGDLLGKIGRCIELEESVTSLRGRFRVFNGVVGDQALEMIDSGLARGLSVGFREKAAHRDSEGTLVVTTGHLIEVSVCREPAFVGAEILRVATAAELRPVRDSELDERLRRAGLLA